MEGNSHRSGAAQEQFIIEEHLSVTGEPTNRSWWSQRTCLEKALIVMLFIAAILAIVMSVIVAVSVGRFFSNSYCTSQDCIQTAARFLDAMDSSVNPCDDFFEYACGSWNRKNVIPDDKPYYNRFSKLREEVKLTLKGLLEEPVTDDDILATQNAKTFYKSCLNISLINSRGDEPLLSLIDQLGGWPVLDASWNESEFDWIELMARLRLVGGEAFIGQWVGADSKKSTVNIIQMDQPGMGMPSRDYYLKQRDAKALIAYQTYATDAAILLGADPERAEREMREMVNLEIRLANITVAYELRRDREAIYRRYTVAELYTNVTPKIDWLKYVTLLFNNASLPITEDEEVVLYATDYMKHLAEVIATTSNRTIANYMMWQIVRRCISSMPQRYRDLLKDYNKAISGTDSERARWNVCVDIVGARFGMAVGRMFVARHFDERAKTSALEMINNIQDAFIELVDKVSWMDTDTREAARLKITVAYELRRDREAIYRRYTVAELYTNVTPKIDWLKYVTLLFNNASLPITEDEEVVLYATDYMKHLAEVIATTSNRTIANYMMWQIVRRCISSMPQRYRDLLKDYNKAISGTDSERARWNVCVDIVGARFGMAVGRMFVARHFDERAKTSALEMINNIQDAFIELVDKVSWMDTDTREAARLKADAIQEHIGYPDYIMNDTALNMVYEGIKTDPKRYFENVIDNNNIDIRKRMRELREPVDKSKWLTSPAVVNAYYSATRNQISSSWENVPLMKSREQCSPPESFNLHFTTKVVQSRQFDKDGNLKQWWSDDVIKLFKEKTQCIIDQYSNYTVEEVNMNIKGRQTQGENIADIGGLKQAFRAYRMWVEQQGHEEDLLTGIDLNHNQLFFLSFAQIWCGTKRPESQIKLIRSNTHSPRKFRVIGALSNSEEFAKAYNCPIGSKMNPVKKCSVW